MPTHALPAVPALDTTTNFALISFLARYRGDTLRAYQQDLKAYVRWRRPSVAALAGHTAAPGAVRAVDGGPRLRARDDRPALHHRRRLLPLRRARRPPAGRPERRGHPAKVPWEAQRRTVLHPLEFAALLTAARDDSPGSHALVALLGMIGLRIGETCRISVTDLHAQAGYELLTVLGKGSKPALIPLPVPVLRAVRETIGDRQGGPLLLNTRGGRLSPSSAATRLQTLARRAGLSRSFSPHSLRRTFCTAGLLINVPLRDMQLAMRHADSRTTLRYDMARANLDRHAAHTVAAYSQA